MTTAADLFEQHLEETDKIALDLTSKTYATAATFKGFAAAMGGGCAQCQENIAGLEAWAKEVEALMAKRPRLTAHTHE